MARLKGIHEEGTDQSVSLLAIDWDAKDPAQWEAFVAEEAKPDRFECRAIETKGCAGTNGSSRDR